MSDGESLWANCFVKSQNEGNIPAERKKLYGQVQIVYVLPSYGVLKEVFMVIY
jgi:hypothetical protein